MAGLYSLETLLSIIQKESPLSITEESVRLMKWEGPFSGGVAVRIPCLPHGKCMWFDAASTNDRNTAIASHNGAIDSMWNTLKRAQEAIRRLEG